MSVEERPREDVDICVQPVAEGLPTRSWFAMTDDMPVPPYTDERVLVADTLPPTAWRGPVRDPMPRFVVYRLVDVALVPVAFVNVTF